MGLVGCFMSGRWGGTRRFWVRDWEGDGRGGTFTDSAYGVFQECK
jgi:hypothetical protein